MLRMFGAHPKLKMYFVIMKTTSGILVILLSLAVFGHDPIGYAILPPLFIQTSPNPQQLHMRKPSPKRIRARNKPRITKVEIGIPEAEKMGMYDIIKLYMNDMCIKEVPFFLSLHRCFYRDVRIANGDTLFLSKATLQGLKDRAIVIHHINELRGSSIRNIDSLLLYKEKKNRKKEALCNFTVYLDPGTYEIPRTGASVSVPGKLSGSIYYASATGKMVVYIHTTDVKLILPMYAKALTFGLIGDMDIGFAELQRSGDSWTAILLYVSGKNESKKSGWSFNVTECNTIRPHSEE
jgi:hypothetical protein